ncbi:MAG: Rid family detoxifying hydrolase, partial [Patescibacteria group bacterium]
MQQKVHTKNAPQALGPYSQAIISGDLIFCSGQIGISPANGELVEGGLVMQTHQVIKNLSAVLEEAGSSLKHVVKTTCYLTNISDFPQFNEVYAEYFGESKQ